MINQKCSMTPRIDLNCDLGELPAERNHDAAIMPYLSSCNIACGFHAGTPLLMERTIELALRHEVKIGAHPSYNDREYFGRRSLSVAPEILLAELRYQICALRGMVESHGERLHHVKPHGALYNDLLRNDTLAEHFVLLVKSIDPSLRIVSLAHGNVLAFCERHHVHGIREGFADRRYAKRTRLQSRREEGAVLHHTDAVLAQVGQFLRRSVRLANDEIVSINIDTICLHGDTPGAVSLGRQIHQYLRDHDVHIRAVE